MTLQSLLKLHRIVNTVGTSLICPSHLVPLYCRVTQPQLVIIFR